MVSSSPSPADAQPEPHGSPAEHTAGVRRALVALRDELEQARSSLDRLEVALTPAQADGAAADGRRTVGAAASCPPAHTSDTPLTDA